MEPAVAPYLDSPRAWLIVAAGFIASFVAERPDCNEFEPKEAVRGKWQLVDYTELPSA